MEGRLWTCLAAAALALLCVAAYSNAFGTGFALDNRQLILQDPRVHAFTRDNLSLVARHTYWWPYGESGLYRPLTTLSYLFNFAVLGNGDRPGGYHWFNLCVHIANVLLFWRLVLRVTADRWTSSVAAAVWAVLPLSVEAVTNIVGRADLMAATGVLVTLLLYQQARDAARAGRQARSIMALSGVAVAVILATLAKESAVAVLALLAVYEALWWRPASARMLLTTGLLCSIPLAVWFVQRQAVLAASPAAEFPFADNPIVGASFWQGRLTAVQVIWRYLALIAWPARLSNDYSFAQIPLARGTLVDWAGCVLLLGGTAASLRLVRARRPALMFAAFAVVLFLPVSNLLFTTGTIMGERLVYLPSAGLAALLAMAMRAAGPSGWRRRAATAAAIVLVTAYGARTYTRNPDWTSDLTLWRSAVAAAPASAKAHRALAEALYESDPRHANIGEVIAEAERGVALLEDVPDEHNTFQAFRQAGAYYLDKAAAVEAAGTSTGDGRAAQLQQLYTRALGRLDRALAIARAGAARIPNGSTGPEADAERLRAAAMLGLGNPSLALDAASRARGLQPLHPLGYHVSSAALLALDRPSDAVRTLLAGSIVTGDSGLGEQAMALYRGGLDAEGCAVTGAGAASALNPQCAIVVRDTCRAVADAVDILARAGLAARAEQTRLASSSLACPDRGGVGGGGV